MSQQPPSKDFFKSNICQSREFCGRCLHSPAFRHNLAKVYKMPALDFKCPNGVVPADVVHIKEETPVVEDPHPMCIACPALLNATCRHSGKQEPWKNQACQANLWRKPHADLPDTATMAWNFAKNVVKSIVTAQTISGAESTEIRASICEACPFRKGTLCTECGCALKIKRVAEIDSCPRGFWPK